MGKLELAWFLSKPQAVKRLGGKQNKTKQNPEHIRENLELLRANVGTLIPCP